MTRIELNPPYNLYKLILHNNSSLGWCYEIWVNKNANERYFYTKTRKINGIFAAWSIIMNLSKEDFWSFNKAGFKKFVLSLTKEELIRSKSELSWK